MLLRGDGIELRPLERSDIERWRLWINDPEIASYLDRVLPVSAPEHESFFERSVIGNADALWYAIDRLPAREHIGNVWLWNISSRNRNAELRIVVGERSAWGSGAGTKAIELLVRHAFDRIGLQKIHAYVMERNPRARASFEKAGFSLEATLRRENFWDGDFHDVYRLARLKGQP